MIKILNIKTLHLILKRSVFNMIYIDRLLEDKNLAHLAIRKSRMERKNTSDKTEGHNAS